MSIDLGSSAYNASYAITCASGAVGDIPRFQNVSNRRHHSLPYATLAQGSEPVNVLITAGADIRHVAGKPGQGLQASLGKCDLWLLWFDDVWRQRVRRSLG